MSKEVSPVVKTALANLTKLIDKQYTQDPQGMLRLEQHIRERDAAEIRRRSSKFPHEEIKGLVTAKPLATDEHSGYRKLKKHGTVRHSAGQYVNGAVHTQTIDG